MCKIHLLFIFVFLANATSQNNISESIKRIREKNESPAALKKAKQAEFLANTNLIYRVVFSK